MKLYDKEKSNILLFQSLVVGLGVIAIITVSSMVNYAKVKTNMIMEFSQQMDSQSDVIVDTLTHHVDLMSWAVSTIASDSSVINATAAGDMAVIQAKLTDFASGDAYSEEAATSILPPPKE